MFLVARTRKTRTRLVIEPARTAIQLSLRYCTANSKSNSLEPHFEASPTMSWLLGGAITAAAFQHCSENTQSVNRRVVHFRTKGVSGLMDNFRTSYQKNTEVEVLLVSDLSKESSFFSCPRCNAGMTESVNSGQVLRPLFPIPIMPLYMYGNPYTAAHQHNSSAVDIATSHIREAEQHTHHTAAQQAKDDGYQR